MTVFRVNNKDTGTMMNFIYITLNKFSKLIKCFYY